MASLPEEYHQGSEIVPTLKGHSNHVAALNLEDDLAQPCVDHDHQAEGDDMEFIKKSGWRNLVSSVGPGFVISMAYLDPSNLETDLKAGANHGYELLWVVLIGMIFAVIIQSLAANLGVSTGKHLSELCKAEYPKYVKLCLWLLAEMAVIAADIPEVIGAACALNILFHIPVWAGVLITGFSTLILLGLEKFGVRKVEMLITSLLFLMAACFFGELNYIKPPASSVVKGMFIPKLSGQGAIGDSIALIGAILTPQNLFLHSALVLQRKIPNSVRGINDACRFYLIETGFALFVAFIINASIVAVSSTICSTDNLSLENADRCNNLSLNSASFLLKNVLGKSSSTVYAIALLASGQSSAITYTYAGQYVMQGFLDLKIKNWIRNLLTRCIAITPSLIVSIIGGASAGGRLIIIANMILSFELPFVLIPLLKFSNSSIKMGPHKNSFYVIFISWILGLLIIGINVYYLSTSFVHWLTHNNLSKVGKFFIGIIVFPLMAIYILAIVYLIFRTDTTVIYIEPMKHDSNDEDNMENGQGQANKEMTLG